MCWKIISFTGNSGEDGGAILIFQNSNINVTIKKNLFSENIATSSYGTEALSIYIMAEPNSIVIENNTFYANRAAGNRRGLYHSEGTNYITKQQFF